MTTRFELSVGTPGAVQVKWSLEPPSNGSKCRSSPRSMTCTRWTDISALNALSPVFELPDMLLAVEPCYELERYVKQAGEIVVAVFPFPHHTKEEVDLQVQGT